MQSPHRKLVDLSSQDECQREEDEESKEPRAQDRNAEDPVSRQRRKLATLNAQALRLQEYTERTLEAAQLLKLTFSDEDDEHVVRQLAYEQANPTSHDAATQYLIEELIKLAPVMSASDEDELSQELDAAQDDPDDWEDCSDSTSSSSSSASDEAPDTDSDQQEQQ